MADVGTDSPVTRDLELYPFIGRTLLVSLGYTAVPFWLNLIPVSRFIALSSNVGKLEW